jgi:hypothetical protein
MTSLHIIKYTSTIKALYENPKYLHSSEWSLYSAAIYMRQVGTGNISIPRYA